MKFKFFTFSADFRLNNDSLERTVNEWIDKETNSIEILDIDIKMNKINLIICIKYKNLI